jgi:hypothetical protein
VRTGLKFPDLTSRDVRAIGRLAGRLSEAGSIGAVGRELLDGVALILPADFMLWNQWTTEMDELLAFDANDSRYLDGLAAHAEALNATIHQHPVIAAGHLDRSWASPQRMSDYQSVRGFRSSALFQEVYRHLDSHYQIAYSAARLERSVVVLSWNLRHRDFTGAEMQRLHLVGLHVGAICRRLDEASRLESAWKSLSAVLSSITGNPVRGSSAMLAAKEGKLLAGLIRGEPRSEIARALQWRRDTLDRQLGGLRERLGFENSSQLMQALAELKSDRRMKPIDGQ